MLIKLLGYSKWIVIFIQLAQVTVIAMQSSEKTQTGILRALRASQQDESHLYRVTDLSVERVKNRKYHIQLKWTAPIHNSNLFLKYSYKCATSTSKWQLDNDFFFETINAPHSIKPGRTQSLETQLFFTDTHYLCALRTEYRKNQDSMTSQSYLSNVVSITLSDQVHNFSYSYSLSTRLVLNVVIPVVVIIFVVIAVLLYLRRRRLRAQHQGQTILLATAAQGPPNVPGPWSVPQPQPQPPPYNFQGMPNSESAPPPPYNFPSSYQMGMPMPQPSAYSPAAPAYNPYAETPSGASHSKT